MVNKNKILLTKAIISQESSQLGLSQAAWAAVISSLCLRSQAEHMALVGHLQGCQIQATAGQRGAARSISVFSRPSLSIRLWRI